MAESAKAAYLRLRADYAGNQVPADEAHALAAKRAHIRTERTKRAYRRLWEQSQPAAPFTVRRAEELAAMAARYGKPDGLKHLESAYLAGAISLEEIETGILAAEQTRQRLADEAVQLAQRKTLDAAAQPQGYVDPVARRWVSPGEPPPIVYERREFTAEEMRGADEDLSERSRRAATLWNIVNGGTPIDEASAAAMGTQYETPRVAIPFLRPSFDQPHGLDGKQADEWKRQAQRDADEAQQTAREQRLQQMREEDRQRAEARQMDRRMGGSPLLGRGR